MKDKVENLRIDYDKDTLDIKDLNADPVVQFEYWFDEAMGANVPEPHAFMISTVDGDGKPSSRIVLLRNADQNGFVFFTNYKSRKGHNIDVNPHVCATFFWHDLQRQVRVEGTIEKISAAESDEYFATRPRESQIGAWASNQSEVLESREALEERTAELTLQYEGQTVPRPPHWGGYRIKPTSVEFWQGRASRLHDRFLYTLEGTKWQISRLNP
jgi:pyridoxamine 5'-phosphate oxidase